MAQIVTITNPLTGQPAQVDQLEHTAQQIDDAIARALPGGGIDTLLNGKAPAGYGIGEEYAARVNDTNLDTLKKGGTYYIGTGCTNTPPNTDTAWSTLHVIPGRACTQIFIPANDANRAGTFSSWIARIYNDKTAAWGAWEWVNPPMILGVEYRTTERYMGKPVYAQLFSVGACSAGSSVNLYKRVGELNTDKIVSYSGYAADCALPYFVEDTTYNIMLAVQKVKDVFDLAINVTTGTSTSFTECYVTVKYTKTTD